MPFDMDYHVRFSRLLPPNAPGDAVYRRCGCHSLLTPEIGPNSREWRIGYYCALTRPSSVRSFPQRNMLIQQYQQLQYEQLMQYQNMLQYQSMMLQQNAGGEFLHKPLSTVDTMHANNIDELKRFVGMVAPSDVKRVIEQSRIVPREMAYTSLIQMAGKMRQIDKAVAIFEAMKDSKFDVKPNMYSYTALISAISRIGDWELAEQYFSEMEALSQRDPTVAPNRVTFSSMIAVYEKAKKFDKAIETFEKQLAANISPDLITYMAVLGACQASRDAVALSRAVDILDSMHESKIVGTPMMYLNLLVACENQHATALRVLYSMRKARVELTASMFNSVMQSLFLANEKDLAVKLAEMADKDSVRLNYTFFDSVLKMCADAGDWKSADLMRTIMTKSRINVSPQCAGLILCAHMQGNDSVEAIERLNQQFKAEDIVPLLPARKEIVECVDEIADVLAVAEDVRNEPGPLSGNKRKPYELSERSVQSQEDATARLKEL